MFEMVNTLFYDSGWAQEEDGEENIMNSLRLVVINVYNVLHEKCLPSALQAV